MTEIDEIVQEFVIESLEGLEQLDVEFLLLESSPEETELLQSIFRTVHSIKGACGFLEFKRLEALAHAGENVLDALRGGTLILDNALTTTLLEMNDALRALLGVIERTGNDQDGDDCVELRERLHAALANQVEPTGPKEETEAEEEEEATAERRSSTTDDTASEASERSTSSALASEGSIRLRVGQLDMLMNLAGELVLARNQILQHSLRVEDSATQATAQHLSRITTELQEGIMKIRMQPISTIWNKLPRMVRGLSTSLSKDVRLDMVGSDTEVDRTLLEAISDPLTHLIRNSIGHGVELPEDREAAGKERTATLRLSAYHDSGQVNIVVTDDGRGIDPSFVRARAVERGLINESQASRMDDRAAIELLFAPGFSTAETVTNVSGRGVGMDVVRKNLEGVGGTVEIHSTLGIGTEVHVRIPLTLAIIPALTVLSSGNRYAIPQANLVELLRLDSPDRNKVERVFGQRVFPLRGELLPLVDLGEQLEVGASPDRDVYNIVVVQAAGRTFGLIVDEIHESEEIVVKPLDRVVKALNAYAGTTILADGRVALIIDVSGLAQRARLMSLDEIEAAGQSLGSKGSGIDERADQATELLVFTVGDGRRLALDLADIDRLEEISPKSVEYAGGSCFLQYRGRLVRLIDVGEALGEQPIARSEDTTWKTVILQRGDELFGLVVGELNDILSSPTSSNARASTHQAIAQVVLVEGKATEIVDEEWLLATMGASKNDREPNVADATSAAGDSKVSDEERPVQLCTFRLGTTLYGINVLDVQEVLRPQQRTPIPLSPPSVEGLMNLRGDTVLSIDLRELMAEQDARVDPRTSEEAKPMNVVIRTQEGSMNMLVDEIGDVIELPAGSFEPCPSSIPESRRHAMRGVFKLPNELLLQLDAQSLLNIVSKSHEPDSIERAPSQEHALA